MDNIEVITFIEKFKNKCDNSAISDDYPANPFNSTIARFLCEEARYRWFGFVEEESVHIDDISCIVIDLSRNGFCNEFDKFEKKFEPFDTSGLGKNDHAKVLSSLNEKKMKENEEFESSDETQNFEKTETSLKVKFGSETMNKNRKSDKEIELLTSIDRLSKKKSLNDEKNFFQQNCENYDMVKVQNKESNNKHSDKFTNKNDSIEKFEEFKNEKKSFDTKNEDVLSIKNKDRSTLNGKINMIQDLEIQNIEKLNEKFIKQESEHK